MISLYKSKKTNIKLNSVNKTVIKTIFRPLNEKEYEIQTLAYTLGVAPKVISHSFDNIEKILTIEMEYVEGLTLNNYLNQPNIDKRHVKHALFAAINKLYNAGIHHRDLIDDNIIVGTQNNKIFVKILDYGHAKLFPESLELRLRDYSIFANKNW